MSEKRYDNYNRWRSKTVAFRMSPEEADELDVQVALSGLSKQDYLIQCCLKHEIMVVCGRKVARKMRMYLEAILEELQFMEEDVEIDKDLLIPLKHVLEILEKEDSEAEELE